MINLLQKSFYKFCSLLSSQQFRRFFIFGLTCNIIYTVSIYLLTEKIKFHYIASVVIALIYTSFLGFCLNKFYTFNTSTKTFFPELIKYYNVMFSGLLINVAWMFILVEVFKLWYMASVVIVSAGLMFYNFFLHKHWSFRGLNKHKKDNKRR